MNNNVKYHGMYYAEVIDARGTEKAIAPMYLYRVRALNQRGVKTKLTARSGYKFWVAMQDGVHTFTSKCGEIIINVYPWDDKYKDNRPSDVF